jgi:CubicO group peptidase (beta-lactamase class C family)
MRVGLVTIVVALVLAAPASAARTCDEPGVAWRTATPAEVGMDAAKLRDAIDYGTANLGFAVRVYRHGCLVGQDRAAAANDQTQFESWSMAKSTVSLLFGRAMTLGLISPDDPVGALVPEADAAHGAIAMRDLLTMTSGLQWNGLRDYNIFTMPDRVRDALTLPIAHPHGMYFEYAQSAVALLAEAIGRAVGEDVQAWGQRQLMDALGIPASAWRWERDPAGHVQGFTGVNMRPSDFAREGDLLRRGGVWRGRRLLAKRYVREALAPSATNGCYGWLIWVNAAKPCIGPTITSRPYDDAREFPDLPADLYSFEGLFGQLVAVFPTQDVEVVRLGQDRGLVFSGGSSWEHDLYAKVLAAITDEQVAVPGAAPGASDAKQAGADYGFQTAFQHPEQYRQGVTQDPLPQPGPDRARALRLRLAHPAASRTGGVTLRVTCPARRPGRDPASCRGLAGLEDTRRSVGYDLAPGTTALLRFRLAARALRSLRRAGALTVTATARNADAASGTVATILVTLHRPRR